MKLTEAIGDTIRFIRIGKDMTLRQMSGKTNIALGYLSQIELGKKNASGEVLEAIADGLDLKPSDLLFEVYEYLKETE